MSKRRWRRRQQQHCDQTADLLDFFPCFLKTLRIDHCPGSNERQCLRPEPTLTLAVCAASDLALACDGCPRRTRVVKVCAVVDKGLSIRCNSPTDHQCPLARPLFIPDPSDDEDPFLFCQVRLLAESGQTADLITPVGTPRTTPKTNTDVASRAVSSQPESSRGDASKEASAPEAETVAGEESTEETGAVRRSSRRLTRTGAGTGAPLLSPSRTAAAPTSSPSEGKRKASPDSATEGGGGGGGGGATSSVTTNSPPSHPVRMLYGSLVANPQTYRSLQDVPSTYFIFPELCIRARGRYRLQVTLMSLPPTATTPPVASEDAPPTSFSSSSPAAASPSTSISNTVLASVTTPVLSVVLLQDYIAPFVTDITKHFARQGAPLPLPSAERLGD